MSMCFEHRRGVNSGVARMLYGSREPGMGRRCTKDGDVCCTMDQEQAARKNCRKGERATANMKMRRQTEKNKARNNMHEDRCHRPWWRRGSDPR